MVLKWSILLLALSLQSSCTPRDQNLKIYDSVDVYYTYWMSTSKFALNPDHLKSKAYYKLTISDNSEASKLYDLVAKNDLADSDQTIAFMDGRLLVEFNTISGEKITYFADPLNICLLEDQTCKVVNDQLRDDLDALIISFDSVRK